MATLRGVGRRLLVVEHEGRASKQRQHRRYIGLALDLDPFRSRRRGHEVSVEPCNLSLEALVAGEAWRAVREPRMGKLLAPHPVSPLGSLRAMLVWRQAPWVLGRPPRRRDCPVPHKRGNSVGIARCEDREGSARRALAEQDDTGRPDGIEYRQEIPRTRLEVGKRHAARKSRCSPVVQDEPRELREPLEQIGERIELPHDLDVAPAFELEDQVNRSFTDDLVRDADSIVRRRIERVRDGRHPSTLSDWSSDTAHVRRACTWLEERLSPDGG